MSLILSPVFFSLIFLFVWKIFSNPEDASTFGGKEMIGDESVERIRR